MRFARWHKRIAFFLGFLIVLVSLFLAGELYIRWFPPRDFQSYLGDQSPQTGPFRSNPRWGVQYQSWDSFASDYVDRLPVYAHLLNHTNHKPIWMMFGSSFVHAPGMLADTTREHLPQREVFNLGRNEPIYVRCAQIQTLLEKGIRPERIFLAIMPLDFLSLYQHSLKQLYINDKGAITFIPRQPEGWQGNFVRNSRLALTFWIRNNLHYGVPQFSTARFGEEIHESVFQDVTQLFSELSELTNHHEVPVTFVLIPNYEQIVKGARCGFQDQLIPLLKELHFDICDVRETFVRYPDKKELFIPDKHFSPLGNRLLLEAILAHLKEQQQDPQFLHNIGRASR